MSEIEKFLLMQEEMRKGNPGIMAGMYELMQVMAYKIVNSISNKDPCIKELRAEDRRQKAHDAASYVIEQYIKRKDFMIREPYLYIKRRVLHELYYVRKCDTMLEYSETIPERETGKHYMYIVENELTGSSRTYETLQEVREIFPKMRVDKLRACINNGDTYKRHKIMMLEMEG